MGEGSVMGKSIPVDYVALRLGLPFVPSYLGQTNNVEDVVHGVNYASAGARIIYSSGSEFDMNVVEMKETTIIFQEDVKGSYSKPLKDKVNRYGGSHEAISNKYAVIREQSRKTSKMKPVDNIASTKVSLLEIENSQSGDATEVPSSGLATKWASVKSGFQSFKAKMEAKKFTLFRQLQDNTILSRASSQYRVSSWQSLDEIFQRLKRPSLERGNDGDEDEDGTDIESVIEWESELGHHPFGEIYEEEYCPYPQ